MEIKPVSKLLSKRMAIFLSRKGIRCFYTGLECNAYAPLNSKNRPSVEHLISDVLYRRNLIYIHGDVPRKAIIDFNNNMTVTAIAKINNLVGSTPIKLKFYLRDYLQSLEVGNLTDDEKLDFYVEHTFEFLKQYRIGNEYPWSWNSVNQIDLRKKLYQQYMELLLPTEKNMLKHALVYYEPMERQLT